MSGARGITISEAAFARMWADTGRSVADIGKALGISMQAVKARAKVRGLGAREKPPGFLIADEARFKAMWSAGVPGPEIAAAFGVSGHTVTNTRRRLGLPTRAAAVRKPFDMTEMTAMWAAGVRVDDIAAHFSVTRRAILRRRKMLGLPSRHRGPHAVISAAEYRAAVLIRAMAAEAATTRAAMRDAEMVDNQQTGRKWGLVA